MALITNWLLTFQALYFFLNRPKDNTSTFDRFWAMFFLFFAVSTFFGGLSHFFFYYTALQGKIPGWSAAVISITFIELATATQLPDKWSKKLYSIIAVKFIVAIAILIFDLDFKWVMVHTGSGLILILGFWALAAHLKGHPSSRYFLWGILAAIAPLPIRALGFDLHEWFNRDDLSHVFMMVTVFLFQKGVKYNPQPTR